MKSPTMKTMDRKTLVTSLSQGANPEEARLVVEDVLEQLGWARKDSFAKDDIPVILLQVAKHAEAVLAEHPGAEFAQMAAGLGQMIAPMKDHIIQSMKR